MALRPVTSSNGFDCSGDVLQASVEKQGSVRARQMAAGGQPPRAEPFSTRGRYRRISAFAVSLSQRSSVIALSTARSGTAQRPRLGEHVDGLELS
jgi:hypothetical protein